MRYENHFKRHFIVLLPSFYNQHIDKDETSRDFAVSSDICELAFFTYIILHYLCSVVFKLVFDVTF